MLEESSLLLVSEEPRVSYCKGRCKPAATKQQENTQLLRWYSAYILSYCKGSVDLEEARNSLLVLGVTYEDLNLCKRTKEMSEWFNI